MSRVFWDAMLLIYLLEDHKQFAPAVRTAMERSFAREDLLLTSYLSIAEALVGIQPGSGLEKVFLETIQDMDFTLLPFDRGAMESFRMVRQQFGLSAPDAMHLACAASAKVDLFLTGDRQILKSQLHIPGIQFIANFEHPPL